MLGQYILVFSFEVNFFMVRFSYQSCCTKLLSGLRTYHRKSVQSYNEISLSLQAQLVLPVHVRLQTY